MNAVWRGRLKRSRDKYSLLKTSWTYQTRQFFENSTLHGVRYIYEDGRPFCEKFMWFCVTSIGGVATLIIIVSLWEKFQTNPTITGLDTDFHNWDVPFPAVSICPFRPQNETAIEEVVQTTWSKPDSADTYRQLLVDLANISWPNMKNFKKYKGASFLPEDNLKSLVSGVLPDEELRRQLEIVCVLILIDEGHRDYSLVHLSCEDALQQCVFKGDDYSCCTNRDTSANETSFLGVLTEVGYCFSFNSRLTKVATKNKNDTFKVKLIYETDEKWILSIHIQKQDDTKGPQYQVFIHSTDEMPTVNVNPQHIWDRRIGKIMFSSKQTYTTDEARQLTIKQRRCIFKDEVDLKTDEIYTYSACMSQCRMNKAKKKCQCVPFFYKQIDGYPHCGLEGLVCIGEHLDEIMNHDDCYCELGCMNTVYEVEKLTDIQNPSDPLEVGFVSWPMVQYKREVLFGWVDLLVSFGGIAGLFLGFSLLSGVEIVYYFTMRACCMVYRNQTELKQLQAEYENVEKPTIDLSLTPKFMKKQNDDTMKTRLVEVGMKNKVGPFPQLLNFNVRRINPRNPKDNFPVPPFNLEFLP